ncbi:hypothetical protein NQ317_010879 [Molorchus minor]|uniref:Uncharacterized protein n=1 Tax=Molorchus minor TaxID=1323400 RepID=A0ABQ9JDG2_9CUCU|nr:hypothetical protein NQ317_010879 [Molorchus minor]
MEVTFQETDRMHLTVNESLIIWPGGQSIKPEGFMIPTHLKVLTIEEKPFVYMSVLRMKFLVLISRTFKIVSHCCKGYCIDLLKELSKKINFTYSLALSPDGQFGNYLIKNLSVGGKKEWTGLIGELVSERADMIVAPLTINPERAEFIEFSKPFKYQGITILEKKSGNSYLCNENTLWKCCTRAAARVYAACVHQRIFAAPCPFSKLQS